MNEDLDSTVHAELPSLALILPKLCSTFRQYVDKELRPLGLYVGQEQALFHLERCDGLTQTELAEKMHCSTVTVAKMVKSLTTSKIIQRRTDVKDGRVQRLFLTQRGKQSAQSVQVLWKEAENRLTAGLSEDRKQEAARVLAQCLLNLAEN